MSTREDDNQLELLQGTLDLLILRTVALGPVHGHAIAKSIEFRSGEVLQVGHGSLYPALQRLIKQGLIAGEDGTSENNRKARFYRLTPKGRRKLFAETSKWQRLSEAVARILTPLAEESK
jgi:PadR family transcriptional regulator PadR